MRTGSVLTALLVSLVVGCGSVAPDRPPTQVLTSINGDSTYQACLPGAQVVGLGGIIAALTPDGEPPRLDGTRIVNPSVDVRINRVHIEVERGTVSPQTDTPLLQVAGLDTAFAATIRPDHRVIEDFPEAAVTARPSGELGPPETLGWHSLVVPVTPSGPRLTVYEMAVDYRVGGSAPVSARLDMQWDLCVDDCRKPCPTVRSTAPAAVPDTEWVTVFSAREAEPWHVSVEMPG